MPIPESPVIKTPRPVISISVPCTHSSGASSSERKLDRVTDIRVVTTCEANSGTP